MPELYQVIPFTRTTTTLAAASATDVLTADGNPGEIGHVGLEIENTGGANALTAAILQVKMTKDGTFQTYISDWVVVSVLMKHSTSNLAILAFGAKTICYLEIPPCHTFKLTLTSASGTTVVVGGFAR